MIIYPASRVWQIDLLSRKIEGDSARRVMIFVSSWFMKSSVFPSTRKRKVIKHFQNFPGLKIVFEKLCFHNGLAWKEGLTGVAGNGTCPISVMLDGRLHFPTLFLFSQLKGIEEITS